MAQPETDFYFQRFGFCERQIIPPPAPDLGIVVVIPCFNEPDLMGGIESLWGCEHPGCAVDVVVVINSAANSGVDVRSQNQKTLQDATAWAVAHSGKGFNLHVLHFPDLPPKQAGVGLARKIGMDEALWRFDEVGNLQGIIACFDADCRCERNYLTSIEQHFQTNPRTPGCSIYFEHPLLSAAITAYELHLRYYVQALRYAGFPYAHHTIGSCMAVRAGIYRKQGGMNKRQAGEDFYFLQKIIPLGSFTDLTETTIFPSPRPSDRVPFGTGRAISDYVCEGQIWTYPLQAFQDLRGLFGLLEEIFRAKDSPAAQLPQSQAMRAFLKLQCFEQALNEIRANTSSEAAFRKRFFDWFNGFQVMKFIHHARDGFYGEKDVATEAQNLLLMRKEASPTAADRATVPPSPRTRLRIDHTPIAQTLEIYRSLDRQRCARRLRDVANPTGSDL